jgi:hypothetical protein
MEVFQELANAAAGTKFETVVAGIALQMTEVIKGRGIVAVGSGTWESIVAAFNGVLHTYENAFSSINPNPTGRTLQEITEPTGPPRQPGRPQSKRFVGEVEMMRNKRRKNVVQTCGFCRSKDHGRQSRCPLMSKLGTKIINFPDFHSFLLERAPFHPLDNQGEVSLKKSMPREARHLVVHRMFSTFLAPNASRPSYLNSVYEATLIGDSGLALPGYTKVLFEGQAIYTLISVISKVKTRYVFSMMESADAQSQAKLSQF